MKIDWAIFFQIASPTIAACIGVILTRYFTKKEKLVAFYGHVASHAHKSVIGGQEVTQINTHAVVIRNDGNKAATNVRILHNILPDIRIYPETEYAVNDLPDGGKVLVIPRIVAKKEYTISYLYFPPLRYHDIFTSIESDAGPAKVIDVRLQQILPRWIHLLRGTSMILGVITSIYILYEVIRHVIP